LRVAASSGECGVGDAVSAASVGDAEEVAYWDVAARRRCARRYARGRWLLRAGVPAPDWDPHNEALGVRERQRTYE
jgi:hypothetical protein